MAGRIRLVAAIAVVFAATIGSFAESYWPEPSNRVDINLGATPWKFIKGDGAVDSGFNDGPWKTVGIPHTWDEDNSYVNMAAGGTGQSAGKGCYRKHFTLSQKYVGKKVFVEFEGAHIGAAVYINGAFIPGNSALNPLSTHVIGFIPFVVDITPYVKFEPAENVLAVRVSNVGGLYADPGFSTGFRYGQQDGGLVRPVWMHITDKVYVPINVYSVVNNWGTCVGTVSATEASATVRMMTHVMNESADAQTVTLTTKVVDASNNIVALTKESSQSIDAGKDFVFDQSGDIANPKLWYPANSIWGKPNMYKVYHIVKVGGKTVDVFMSPLGIRQITWDKNFAYINGHQHYLWGMSGCGTYPALGSAMPEELLWKDAKLTADGGGRIWRPSHSACAREFVDACDAFGVMLDQPSGDGEGVFMTGSVTANQMTLKTELHRDMIVHDRNNPSILMWEASNGPIDLTFSKQLKSLAKIWDPIYLRPQADRGSIPSCTDGVSDVIGCTIAGCAAQMKTMSACADHPAFDAEAWGIQGASRWAWDYELDFAGVYIQSWKNGVQAKTMGLANYYMAEAPGEDASRFLGADGKKSRSFGSSAMDANRIPKLLYNIYRVAWTPYQVKPSIVIAHHWNRSGTVRVNVFSNCPKVRLLLNQTNLGEKVPNPPEGTGLAQDQTSTQLPFQCWWDVPWVAGTLRAEGLDSSGNIVCSDEKVTAGAPDHIELTVEPRLVKPDGAQFRIVANGTDVATILAKVVDAKGVWCPTASNLITFSVSGSCEYRGGADQFVTEGQPVGYHAPLDRELAAEGGMCKIALRSTFASGTVMIVATSAGLSSGTASYLAYPPTYDCACESVSDLPFPQPDQTVRCSASACRVLLRAITSGLRPSLTSSYSMPADAL